MNQKIYKLMKWADIEEIIYGESDHPQTLLGAHPAGTQTLVQAYFPGAESVKLTFGEADKNITMEREDENGYFAALIPNKNAQSYRYLVKYACKAAVTVEDPYRFDGLSSAKDIASIENGTLASMWKKMGGRITKQQGVSGALFRVYAPHAISVCITGDFNDWATTAHPMMRVGDSGVFELFVPGAEAGMAYLYEIHMSGGRSVLKPDPFAQITDVKDRLVSVLGAGTYRYHDQEWMTNRKKLTVDSNHSILKLDLNDFLQEVPDQESLPGYVDQWKKLGFSCVMMGGLLSSREGDVFQRSATTLYALPAKLSQSMLVQKLVDLLHQAGIAVMAELNLTIFSKQDDGPVAFDGQAVFEDPDSRRGYQPAFDAMQYNFGSPFTVGYLKNAALYWIHLLHLDGICLLDLATMLYLDYGREGSAYTCNLYGGNECLEAITFLRELNECIRKEWEEVVSIAELSALWSGVTDSEQDNSLGFDFCYNNGWKLEMEQYVKGLRGYGHDKFLPLSRPMTYQYCEHFLLPLDYELADILNGLYPEEGCAKEKELIQKALIAYTFTAPGIPFIDSKLLTDPDHFGRFILELNRIKQTHGALYGVNSAAEGFDWLHAIAGKEGLLSFARTGHSERLVIAANFGEEDRLFRTGVTRDGRYEVIFYSADSRFGVTAAEPEQNLYSDGERFEEQEYSITLELAAHSVAVLSYSPYCSDDLEKMAARIEVLADKAKNSRTIAATQLASLEKQEKEAERADQRAQEALAKARALAEDAKAQMEHVWESRQLAEQFAQQAEDYDKALAEAQKKLEEVSAQLKA